jgi:GNAT superfamily N-acetyltransferase
MMLTPLAQIDEHQLTALWNAAIGDRFPMRPALLRRNLFGDLNFLPEASFAACDDDGRLVGFIGAKLNREFSGVLSPRQGYINSLIVHPDHRRQGIGTALFQAAVDVLSQHAPARIHIGRDTFHFFPGVPEEIPEAVPFFAAMGAAIAANRETDLVAALADYDLPAEVKATIEREPVAIRPCRPDEVSLLADHLRRDFPGRWQYEFAKFIYDGGDPADYMIVREGDRVIGFCHMYTPESVWTGPSTYWSPLYPRDRFGGYGPLGVTREARGRGLGLAVTAAAVLELKRRGITRAGVDWTGLVDFYGRLGFTPWKRYFSAALELNANGR